MEGAQEHQKLGQDQNESGADGTEDQRQRLSNEAAYHPTTPHHLALLPELSHRTRTKCKLPPKQEKV